MSSLAASARCVISGDPVVPILNFGMMPIANGFLAQADFLTEKFFKLEVGICESSGLVQLTSHVPPNEMFHGEYAFFSSTSRRMAAHFEEFAQWVISTYVDADDPLVVEIGSNDGILLQHLAKAGIPHLGIEPSENVAEVARNNGVRTISRFFDENLGEEIAAEYGKADAFIGANVMCHIPTLNSVAAGIKKLLKPKGVLIFEDPYLGDIVQKTSYDQIYDEHATYFCVLSVQNWFALHDMEVIDVLPQTTHGGSMRYVVANRGARPVHERVKAVMARELTMGLTSAETMAQFARNVERSKHDLMELLERLQLEGKDVVGYGATSKSTTVTNYCGITPAHVSYICDTTPIKQGKFSPGAHIPIKDPAIFHQNPPDVALLFAWNHADEIMAKETSFVASGGQWLTYVPVVRLQ